MLIELRIAEIARLDPEAFAAGRSVGIIRVDAGLAASELDTDDAVFRNILQVDPASILGLIQPVENRLVAGSVGGDGYRVVRRAGACGPERVVSPGITALQADTVARGVCLGGFGQ